MHRGDDPGKPHFVAPCTQLAIRNLQNGVATFATTGLAAGAHTICAFFVRNGNFAPSIGGLRQHGR